MCARRLATEALTRGAADNITVIVAFLRPLGTLEAVFGGGRQVPLTSQCSVGQPLGTLEAVFGGGRQVTLTSQESLVQPLGHSVGSL